MLRRGLCHFLTLVVLAALLLGAQAVWAASTLDLLGVGWNKSPVTVLINHARGVTPAAVADVETAITDWNNAISGAGISGAPTLQEVTGVTTADIVIYMKVGGGVILGQTLPKTISPFSCALKSVRIQLSGKAFGLHLSDAGTRNVARHELGHAFGLGHSDDDTDLMFPTFDTAQVFGTSDVSISSCDLKGIDAIYPLPTVCNLPASVTCP